MENIADKDNLVVFRTSQGAEVRAVLVRLGRFAAVFEIYDANIILQTSEILGDFQIYVKDRTVYSGRAVARAVVNVGAVVVCEADLDDFGFNVELFSAVSQANQVTERFAEFFQQWQKVCKVLPEFKVAVADIQTFLIDLRRWMEQLELGIRSSPHLDRVELERAALEKLGPQIVPIIDHFFEKFEKNALALEAERVPMHRSYLQRHLHPLMLCSPFAYRTFAKPLGYAGDYEMVNMLARDPYEGSTVFAKVVNLWFLKQPPAEAHRNRLQHLTRKLLEETLRVRASGRPARVFNLACGPALEMQRFLAEHELSDEASLSLLDFSDETVAHTRGALAHLKQKHHRVTPVQVIKKSVQQLLKETGRSAARPPEQQYDFVYCAGMFDYLSDQICQRLTDALYGWVAPGGLLLVTNVEASNPLRYGMEHLLDWHLVYRTAAQLRTLKPKPAPADSATVIADATGVNLMLEVRKPNHV